MERPLLFIGTNEDGQMSINDEVIDILSDIDKPVATVAIVGKYRTGKSYLLNLLMGRGSGFDLGSTIQAKTKGIWIWCRPHPIYEDRYLILLDTEGLSDVEKGNEKHDNQIFALSILLTSCLVYNSMGRIDNEALQKLHFITSLTKHLKVKASEEETGMDFDGIFPFFIWVVRDFTLKLELNGKPCTSDEYLENALELKKGLNKATRDFNLPRKCLQNFFRRRRCFTTCRPVDDDDKIKCLDSVATEQLKPEFLQQMGLFKKLILQDVKIMKVHGISVTGRRFVEIAKFYITAINKGVIPCVESAVQAMGRAECLRALDQAKAKYSETFRMQINGSLPKTTAEMSCMHTEAEKQALIEYSRIAIFDHIGNYQQRLQGEILSLYHCINEENDKASTQKCEVLLDQLTSTMKNKIEKAEYIGTNCYVSYKADFDEVIKQYEAEPHKGPSHKAVLAKFLEDKKSEGVHVLAMDKALSEKEKEFAAKEEERKRAEQDKLAAEESEQRAQKQLEDLKNSFQANMQQMHEDMEKSMQDIQKSNEELLEKRQEDLDKMLEKGLEQQAEMLKQSLKTLEQEKKEMEEIHKRNMAGLEESLKQRTEQCDNMIKTVQEKQRSENIRLAANVLGSALHTFNQQRTESQKNVDANSALQSDGILQSNSASKTPGPAQKDGKSQHSNRSKTGSMPQTGNTVQTNSKRHQGNKPSTSGGVSAVGGAAATNSAPKITPDLNNPSRRGGRLPTTFSGIRNDFYANPNFGLNDYRGGRGASGYGLPSLRPEIHGFGQSSEQDSFFGRPSGSSMFL